VAGATQSESESINNRAGVKRKYRMSNELTNMNSLLSRDEVKRRGEVAIGKM